MLGQVLGAGVAYGDSGIGPLPLLHQQLGEGQTHDLTPPADDHLLACWVVAVV